MRDDERVDRISQIPAKISHFLSFFLFFLQRVMDKTGEWEAEECNSRTFHAASSVDICVSSAYLSMLTACRRTVKLYLEQDDAIGTQGTVLQETPCARSPSQTSLAISTSSCRESRQKVWTTETGRQKVAIRQQ